MSVTDKIEEAKNCFGSITMSGRNNYQKFDYFELKDILPMVRGICKKFKLKTKIDTDLERQCFVLTITDREDNSSEEFTVPYAPISAGDAGKWMQDYGRCQTYARRYLYLQAFEIAEPDEIDNKDQRKQRKSVPQKVEKTGTKTKTQPKEEEPTKEDIKKALDSVYYHIVDGGAEFTYDKAVFKLKRLYNDKPKLVDACIKSLEINKAGGKEGWSND